jgi:hypothetical protein
MGGTLPPPVRVSYQETVASRGKPATKAVTCNIVKKLGLKKMTLQKEMWPAKNKRLIAMSTLSEVLDWCSIAATVDPDTQTAMTETRLRIKSPGLIRPRAVNAARVSSMIRAQTKVMTRAKESVRRITDGHNSARYQAMLAGRVTLGACDRRDLANAKRIEAKSANNKALTESLYSSKRSRNRTESRITRAHACANGRRPGCAAAHPTRMSSV